MEASSQPQVFINFRGDELRHNFVSYLVKALEKNGINFFIDKNEQKGHNQRVLFKRIEESKIALAIFSSRYTESTWCLEELVKMKECMDADKLVIIPIFYIVTPYTIKKQMGDFGDKLRVLVDNVDDVTEKKWIDALKSVPLILGLTYDGKRDEDLFIAEIIGEVQKVLQTIGAKEREREEKPKIMRANNNRVDPENENELAGLSQRLKELTEKLELSCKETRIIGVFGMPGIGKTTLVKKLYDELKHKFQRHVHMVNIRQKSDAYGTTYLNRMILKGLLSDTYEITGEMTYASEEPELRKKKVLLVLDDVSSKEQIEALLGNHNWIRKGSRIVLTTRDKISISQLEYTYDVPRLDPTDGLKQFSFYAFEDHNCPSPGNLMELSTKFVDYARGNPKALQMLGLELLSIKNKDHWSKRLDTMAQVPSPCIQILLGESYNELNKQQKEAFLAIAYFFRSEDEYYVRCLVDLKDPDTADDTASEIKDLADKLLISISSGRVEMHDLLSTFAKKLCSSLPDEMNYGYHMFWNNDIFTAPDMRTVNQPKKKDQLNLPVSERANVRGILLDMHALNITLTLDSEIFSDLSNLRYLKVYNSQCSRGCDADSKLNFPDKLKCSMEHVRYLHWLRFPLKNLPKEFNPKHLIELNLPYSKITRLWKDSKETSKLKWVDLSHSSELCDIAGLLGARNIKRLNLEGCTSLETLPQGMQEMESLVYLNMGGCTRLVSLPELKLKSLKTLILTHCLNLEQFPVISESLEALYLQGTAIKAIPTSIEDLQKLVILNLKDCKALVSLPNCLGKLRALQELILSGCSKLDKFPEFMENMKSIYILLLDGTAIKQMPKLLQCSQSNGQAFADKPFPNPQAHCSLSIYLPSSLLLSLCLSGNDIESLEANISQLYYLKWLDLKNCKKLKSVPMLPPNLNCLDAHGCDSLEKVGGPLTLLMVTGQIHCTFIFTNCNKLDQVAKSNIISYTRRKSQLMSDARDRYNGGFVMESLIGTCYPGCEVPTSFDHQAFGASLERKLPRHWYDSRLTGISLCAVIWFPDYQHQSNRFLVKCTCKFETEDGLCISFSSIIGGWREPGDEPRKIESAHVFTGYTSWLDINKRHVANHGKGCIPSKASLIFQVTDGANEVAKCQVLKCGFTFVYTQKDSDSISRETTGDITPRKEEDDLESATFNKPS